MQHGGKLMAMLQDMTFLLQRHETKAGDTTERTGKSITENLTPKAQESWKLPVNTKQDGGTRRHSAQLQHPCASLLRWHCLEALPEPAPPAPTGQNSASFLIGYTGFNWLVMLHLEVLRQSSVQHTELFVSETLKERALQDGKRWEYLL